MIGSPNLANTLPDSLPALTLTHSQWSEMLVRSASQFVPTCWIVELFEAVAHRRECCEQTSHQLFVSHARHWIVFLLIDGDRRFDV